MRVPHVSFGVLHRISFLMQPQRRFGSAAGIGPTALEFKLLKNRLDVIFASSTGEAVFLVFPLEQETNVAFQLSFGKGSATHSTML